MKTFFHPDQKLHHPQTYFSRGMMRKLQEVPSRLDALGALDREGLKQALAIVRGFRDWITQHFRLQT